MLPSPLPQGRGTCTLSRTASQTRLWEERWALHTTPLLHRSRHLLRVPAPSVRTHHRTGRLPWTRWEESYGTMCDSDRRLCSSALALSLLQGQHQYRGPPPTVASGGLCVSGLQSPHLHLVSLLLCLPCLTPALVNFSPLIVHHCRRSWEAWAHSPKSNDSSYSTSTNRP